MKRLMCWFVGWDYNQFKQCEEASLRMLKTYTYALLIVMIIWFTIGFVVSQRYIGISSLPGQLSVGLMFTLLVYLIEKIVILHTSGKAVVWFRLFIAVCMALLGSFILDQLIFRNDLENAIRDQETIKVQKQIDDLIVSKNKQILKLKHNNDSIYNEIAKKPVIQKINTETVNVPNGLDSNGVQQYRKVTNVQSVASENPLQEQARANEQRINQYQNDILQLENKNVNDIVNDNIKNKRTGFLEELKASWNVITSDSISITFYVLLFLFMCFLELFVVSIKLFKSKNCGYDMITKHNRDIKELQLKQAMENRRKEHLANINIKVNEL